MQLSFYVVHPFSKYTKSVLLVNCKLENSAIPDICRYLHWMVGRNEFFFVKIGLNLVDKNHQI